MENFDYKEYSLENISKWVQDAICAEIEPEKIYNAIKEAVKEEYYIFKNHTSRCYELLSLLNSNNGQSYEDVLKEKEYYEGWDTKNKSQLICDKNDPSPECKNSWTSFWEENYYPEENSQYTEEELNAMCDKAASDDEKDKCREYNLREAEYYNKRAELDLNPGPHQKYVGWTEVNDTKFNEMFPGKEKHKSNLKEEISRNDPNRIDYKDGMIYESPDGGKTVYARKPGEKSRTVVKEENKTKWILSVEEIGNVQFVTFPEDLLKAANLKEGDEVEWIENKDGSYTLRKLYSLMHHSV